MEIGEYKPVFNTALRFTKGVELQPDEVKTFLAEAAKQIPELSVYRQSENGPNLAQMLAGEKVREILVGDKEITLAVAPPLTVGDADATARALYPVIESHIHVQPLFIEFLHVAFRFGFPFKGNHDSLVLNELFAGSPFALLAQGIQGAIRDFQPKMNLSLTKDHSLQAVVEVQTFTSRREIESGLYDGDEVRIVCGVAKVSGLAALPLAATYAAVYEEAVRFVNERVLGTLVEKLRRVTELGTAVAGDERGARK